MSQGNFIRTNTHEEQDKTGSWILSRKKMWNVGEKKKTNNTFSNWATVQIFMRNTMLSHNQRETEAIFKQYSIDAGEQFTSAEIVGEIQTQI